LDAGLNNDQKNVSHAMISMIENHLVWWVDNTVSKTWYLFLLIVLTKAWPCNFLTM
jgi:hypothetical protein